MPIVRIDIQAGKTTAHKRALLRGVREALVEELGVPHERVMQRIVETQAADIDTAEVRSDHLTIVEIAMLRRPPDLKEKLYRGISKRLGLEPGIAEHDLVVLVSDPAAECFFVNGNVLCDTPTASGVVEPADDGASESEPEPTSADTPAPEIAEEPAQ